MPANNCHADIRRTNIIIGTHQRYMANLMLSHNALYLAYQIEKKGLMLDSVRQIQSASCLDWST